MNLGDLTNLVEKPIAAVSNLLNTPNSAGRYRPFYLQNVIDAVQGRSLEDAVAGKVVVVTGGSSGIGEAVANKIAAAGGEVVLVARTARTSTRSSTPSVDILINNAGRSIRRSLGAVLRPDPRLPAHRAAELPRCGPAHPQIHPRHARTRRRPDHQPVVCRSTDPRASLGRLHRQQGCPRHAVRLAAGRNRQRRRAIHHRPHGARENSDDQPDQGL
jgi:hypothetical protein